MCHVSSSSPLLSMPCRRAELILNSRLFINTVRIPCYYMTLVGNVCLPLLEWFRVEKDPSLNGHRSHGASSKRGSSFYGAAEKLGDFEKCDLD